MLPREPWDGGRVEGDAKCSIFVVVQLSLMHWLKLYIFIFSVVEALRWKNGFDLMMHDTTVLTVRKDINCCGQNLVNKLRPKSVLLLCCRVRNSWGRHATKQRQVAWQPNQRQPLTHWICNRDPDGDNCPLRHTKSQRNIYYQEMVQTHGSIFTNANYSFSQRSVQFLVQTCNVTRLLFSVVCYYCK